MRKRTRYEEEAVEAEEREKKRIEELEKINLDLTAKIGKMEKDLEKYEVGYGNYYAIRAKNAIEASDLCTNISKLFDMPKLRSIIYYLIQSGDVKNISYEDLFKKSRINLCHLLAEELSSYTTTDEKKILKAPYKEIDESDIAIEKSIPSWAWDDGFGFIMFGEDRKPFALSSGRSLSRQSYDGLVSPKRDPKTREALEPRIYDNWNLEKAIEDFIFMQTGFTKDDIKSQMANDDVEAKIFYRRGLDAYRGVPPDYKFAIENYTRAIEIAPSPRSEFYTERGNSYKKLSLVAQALSDYKKSIEIDPNDFGVWFNRGVTYSSIKSFPEALNDFKQAIALNPTHADSWYLAGLAYKMTKQYPEALTAFNKAIELAPGDDMAWYERGLAKFEIKQYIESIEDFDNAIRLSPLNAEYRFDRGLSYVKLNEFKMALFNFDEAIKLNPTNPKYWYYRGLVYDEMGEYDKATSDIAEVFRLNPKYIIPEK